MFKVLGIYTLRGTGKKLYKKINSADYVDNNRAVLKLVSSETSSHWNVKVCIKTINSENIQF